MIHKVKNAVTRRLHEAFGTGCEIYSEEVEQKAAEPFVFVEFFPAAFELESEMLEKQTIGVRLIYVPKKYSQDVMLDAVRRIKGAFLYRPLEIDGRAVQTYRVECDISSDDCLVCTMSYTVYVDPGIMDESEFEDMRDMELNL